MLCTLSTRASSEVTRGHAPSQCRIHTGRRRLHMNIMDQLDSVRQACERMRQPLRLLFGMILCFGNLWRAFI